MAELVDALASGASDLMVVEIQGTTRFSLIFTDNGCILPYTVSYCHFLIIYFSNFLCLKLLFWFIFCDRLGVVSQKPRKLNQIIL